MRTALLRLLPIAALALPLVALTAVAQDKPSHRCAPAGAAQATAPQSPIQQTPLTPPQVPDAGFPEGPPPGLVYPQPCPPAVVPPSAPAAPTLEEMVKELKQLREKEKKLAEAIREKVKAQRKALDDAEREVGGDVVVPVGPPTPCR